MINKNFTYALVGASPNISKYWNKILKDFIESGYKIIPVNPKEKNILWLSTYSSLSEIPLSIDVVICVVPPNITEKIIKEVISLWIKNVWLQPWSQNESIIKKCFENWITVVYNSCIMIQRKINM